MLLSLEQVQTALACPVEVTGGAVVRHGQTFIRDGEGKLRVCRHETVDVVKTLSGLKQPSVTTISCRCGFATRVYHPLGALRNEAHLSEAIADAVDGQLRERFGVADGAQRAARRKARR